VLITPDKCLAMVHAGANNREILAIRDYSAVGNIGDRWMTEE